MGLGTSTRGEKIPFLVLFQMVIGAQVFFHIVFVYKQFYDFPKVFCIFRLFFAWYPNSDLGFEFLVKFTSSSAHIFLNFFQLLCNRQNTNAKMPKNPMFAETGANTLANNGLLYLMFPRLY